MEKTPFITIDLGKIEENSKYITNVCKSHGVKVWGVTKVTLGDPKVGYAMVKGGCIGLADSRLEDLECLKKALPNVPLMLIRPPGKAFIDDVIRLADVSLQSDFETIKLLAESALKQNRVHKIILMVELGDLREGVMPEDVEATVFEILRTPGIELEGLGGVLTCFAGVIPNKKNLGQIVDIAKNVEKTLGIEIKTIAPCSTNAIPMIITGQLPERINEFRVGEGILLGCDVIKRDPLPNCHQDAFILSAEIIESRVKPSKPNGVVSQDAFGEKHEFSNKGLRKRAIINVGRQDTEIDLLHLMEKGAEILGGSSDHIVLDVENCEKETGVGDILHFRPGYGALLRLMGSKYVEKIYI